VERRYFGTLHYLALTCEDEVLVERLRQRPSWRQTHLKSGVEPSFQYKVVGTVQPSVTSSKPTHGVMQPGMKFSLKPLPIEGLASKADIDDLINGRYIVYLSGTITYEDVFEKPHETRFCLYLQPDLAAFSACSTNNEAN
jgi:hypothetical protein